MKSPVTIPIPARINPKDPVRAEWANQLRDCIQRLSGRGVSGTEKAEANDKPPFYPSLIVETEGESTTYYVAFTRGVLVETITRGAAGSDFIKIHEFPELIDGDGNPEKFEITAGQSAYVKYALNADGSIKVTETDKPTVSVLTDGEKSTEYTPPTGDDDEGAVGGRVHKLCNLTVAGGVPTLTLYEAGNNLYYDPVLPMFVKEYGTHDIFKEYDLAVGKYKTKGLTEKLVGPDSNVQTVEIDGTSEDDLKFSTVGSNFNLKINNCRVYLSTGIMTVDTYGDPVATIYFRGGIAFMADPDGAVPPDIQEINVNSLELGSWSQTPPP